MPRNERLRNVNHDDLWEMVKESFSDAMTAAEPEADWYLNDRFCRVWLEWNRRHPIPEARPECCAVVRRFEDLTYDPNNPEWPASG